jgi:hypothetical protein
VIQQLLSEKKTRVAFKKGKALMAFEAERFREAKAADRSRRYERSAFENRYRGLECDRHSPRASHSGELILVVKI